MPELDLNLISIIVFYSIIAAFFIIRRKRIEIQSKIFILYKTKRFNNLLQSIAKKAPKFWTWFGYAAIPIGFIGMIAIFGYLSWSLVRFIIDPVAVPTLSLVIPGVRIPGASFFLPFWYGIISLFVVILVHEGAHGVVANALKLKVKSAGVGLLAILPLAFVEPDEEQLKKQTAKKQLAVFSAGAFANFLTGAIVLLLATFLIAPVAAQAIVPNGIVVESVTEDFPAAQAGITKGLIVTSVDGQDITKIDDFVDYMENVEPGQAITIGADSQAYEVTTIANPENATLAHVGMQFKQNLAIAPELQEKYGRLPWLIYYTLQLFYWMFVLNIGIGIINLLPLGPIDGGRMAYTALDKMKNKERAKKLFSFLTIASLLLLIANLIGPYIVQAL